MNNYSSNLDSVKNVIAAKNIADAFYRISEANPNLIAFSQAIAGEDDVTSSTPRLTKSSTYSEIKQRVNKIADFLLSKGVKPDSKIAILSATRPEWMEADLAILACSAVSVSVFQSLPADDIAYILYDSGADFVFVENQDQLNKIVFINQNEMNIPANEDRPATTVRLKIKSIISFEEIEDAENATTLSTILSAQEKQIPIESNIATLNSLAALVYTSGTTGPPKGVMQTHGNHLANVRQAYESGLLNKDTILCLILPLAHSFAKLIGYLGFLTEAKIHFPAVVDKKSSKLDPKSASKDIRESKASIFPVVPRLLEKMQEGILAAQNQAGLKGKLVKLTLSSATAVYQGKKTKQQVSLKDKLTFAATKGLRNKIKKQIFGTNFSYALSGGAKLPVPTSEFFASIEIDVIEGYGLTETCVATNVGRLGKISIGTVGPVLSKDIQLRIAEDGEILFKGPNIAIGYYNRPTATSQSWDNEKWFHTGDLGSVDSDGNLTIVGRKKEIIVTSGGKNIAPHDIEVAIKSHPMISQAVLVGDGRKYCVAILTLNHENSMAWANDRGIYNLKSLSENAELREELHSFISTVNKDLASFETVKNFYIAPEDFTTDNGFLTPTFKIKRALVEKKYQKEIEAMY